MLLLSGLAIAERGADASKGWLCAVPRQPTIPATMAAGNERAARCIRTDA